MKIIFDSEEQKEAALDQIYSKLCPGLFLLKEFSSDKCNESDCDECWNSCELEMEVSDAHT